MLKKVYEYLLSHSIYVMVIGFVVALGGLLVYMQTRYMGNYVPRLAFGVTIAGFVIYIVGRVFVAAQRRKKNAIFRRDSNT
jgi:glucan phosphoethanolaminetransferase (alkaline phosphatase superfamily)